MSPARKREVACKLQDQFAVSERRACRVLDQPRSSQRLEAAPERPEPVTPFVREQPKVGRNQPCPCGSGKKYKQCHGRLS